MHSVLMYLVAFVLFYICLSIVYWLVDEGDYWRRRLQGMFAYRSTPWEILTLSAITALAAALAQGLANFFLYLLTL